MNVLSESEQLQTIEPVGISGHDDRKGKSRAIAHPQTTVFWLEKGIEVVPLHEKDGQSNFTDQILGQVFRRIVREDTLNKLFYDGSVRNTRDFRKFMRNPENEIFFVNFNGREAGFFWLNHFRQKSFFINYCLYKEFWGEAGLTISNLCIEHLFKRKDADGDFLVDVLLGLTPANNKLAVNFLLQNEMSILGKVPGFLYDSATGETVDGVFSYRQRSKKSGFKMSSFFFG
ncbi:MAG: hypothetical protein KKG47_10605 [Proteobacteria bacterium]|nr:hypothetical protein [Pseudomonadota bacterium]MBU1738332.1 hypothetical protein [Pseudomonadota bacterium]